MRRTANRPHRHRSPLPAPCSAMSLLPPLVSGSPGLAWPSAWPLAGAAGRPGPAQLAPWNPSGPMLGRQSRLCTARGWKAGVITHVSAPVRPCPTDRHTGGFAGQEPSPAKTFLNTNHECELQQQATPSACPQGLIACGESMRQCDAFHSFRLKGGPHPSTHTCTHTH